MPTLALTAVSRRAIALAFAFAILVSTVLLMPSSASAAMDLEAFDYETTEQGGSNLLEAGAHPDETAVTFEFGTDSGGILPLESAKDIAVDLPLGSVGSPASIPTCTNAKLVLDSCPPDTQVGTVGLGVSGTMTTLPVYNLAAPPGVLAQFGFHAQTLNVHLTAKVHSRPRYGVTITTVQTPQTLPLIKIVNTFWGVPAASSHDEDRGICTFFPHGSGCSISAEADEVAFLTNPSACSSSSMARARVNSWFEPNVFAEDLTGNVDEAGEQLGVTACDGPDFSPTVAIRPSIGSADSPTGVHVNVHLPQSEDPSKPAEAQLKDATIVFPEGLTINPASGAGLEACSPTQVGLVTGVGDADAQFDESSVACPDAAKLGTVTIATPLIAQPLSGAIYLAQPYQNPFGSLVAFYVVVEDPQTGVIIKIPGRADLDPRTGQLTAVFPNNPQLPFEDFDVELFKGTRAALKTPLSCGTYTTQSTLVPWTAPVGPERHPTDSFQVSSAARPGSCPQNDAAAPNSPQLEAGTVNPAAGAYSPFTLKLSRADGTQPIKGLEATLPPGLLGRLAGVSYCPEASLAAAASRTGQQELDSPSCPGSSRVGSVTVAAGAGPDPLYVGGQAYLAGPYQGAPLSLAIVTPAVAGPFDLGDVVVRTALHVDPETTQIHAVSDPIPAILKGIPLDLRSVAVRLDRPDFTLNPTHCDGGAIDASTVSIFDQSASLSSPFAAGGCRALGFKPKLAIDLKGGTRRSQYPALRATLKARPGDANIAKAVVRLPHSEFLAQNHIGTVCTRVQFAADACPKRSIYGRATAVSPLLDEPLTGPVYLRSSDHKLPDLVADLNGQIRVTLAGRIDSANGGIRNSFEMVPDAPVSKFVLRMQGGKKGLLENSRNLCRSPSRASVQFDGHNGKIWDFKPRVTNDCRRSKRKAKHHQRR